MKKIIIPFDGNEFPKGAFLFAKNLHKIKPVLISGVFLPTVEYARFFLLPATFAAPVYMPLMEYFDEENVEANVEMFTELCQKHLIEYQVHQNLYESAVPVLIKETRFADLMIIGSETFYTNAPYGSNEYLKDALHHAECPVIIVPDKFNFPSNIMLAYDGSASSVFAIRQFASLFPELCNRKTTLVYVGDQKHSISDQILIEELAARHFKDVNITKLTSQTKDEINTWFALNRDTLVVSGSFGRSGLSELFKKSFIMDLIKRHKIPVFIAHR